MNNENKLVYLDNDFIIKKYEKIKGKTVHSKYTKTNDVSVGINFGASAGASLKETFEYPINIFEMYKKIEKKLNKIPTIKLKDNDIKNLPDLFWIEGLFGIGSSELSTEKIKRYYFAVADDNCKDCSKQLSLTTNSTYFTSGYDQLLAHAPSFADQYKINAKILLKFIGVAGDTSIATPIIIFKS